MHRQVVVVKVIRLAPAGGQTDLAVAQDVGRVHQDHARRQVCQMIAHKTLTARPPPLGNADDPLAALQQEQGKADEAAKAFAAIAANGEVPAPLRDYAVVRETAIRFDALPPQQVVDRLKPMAVPGNPWFGSAGEMTGLALLKLGKPDLAGAMFAAVAKDQDAPDSLRDRMRQMANQLGADAGEADVAHRGHRGSLDRSATISGPMPARRMSRVGPSPCVHCSSSHRAARVPLLARVWARRPGPGPASAPAVPSVSPGPNAPRS